jgi:hypothetical protein
MQREIAEEGPDVIILKSLLLMMENSLLFFVKMEGNPNERNTTSLIFAHTAIKLKKDKGLKCYCRGFNLQ